MKTSITPSDKIKNNLNRLSLGIITLSLILVLKPSVTLSQPLEPTITLSQILQPSIQTPELPKYKIGMEIGTNISGNGHGTFYEGGITLSNKKNVFLIGTCIQKRKTDLCGLSFNYMRTVLSRNNFAKKTAASMEEMDEFEKMEAIEEMEELEAIKNNKNPERLQLFFFTKAQYIHHASLSFNGVKHEENFSKEKNNDIDIDFNNYKTSTVEFYAGFGLNVNISKNLTWTNSIGFGTYYHLNYIPGMYKDQIAPVMMLKTSIRINNFSK